MSNPIELLEQLLTDRHRQLIAELESKGFTPGIASCVSGFFVSRGWAWFDRHQMDIYSGARGGAFLVRDFENLFRAVFGERPTALIEAAGVPSVPDCLDHLDRLEQAEQLVRELEGRDLDTSCGP